MLLIRVLIYKVRANMIHSHLLTQHTGLRVDVTLRHSIKESDEKTWTESEPFFEGRE